MTETPITLSGQHFIEGARIVFYNGQRAIIRKLDDHTATVVWRNAWYWRVLWWVEDLGQTVARALFS